MSSAMHRRPLGAVCQTLVGAGYQFPAITVAPGQVIPIIVSGMQTVLPAPIHPHTVPLPVVLAGISVTLHQSLPDRTWQLSLFSVAQTNACQPSGTAASCLKTAITAQIPFDITV